MNKFFIENPYLEGQLDLKSDNFYINKDINPDNIGERFFLEDLKKEDPNAPKINKSEQFWSKISKEVDSTYNIKKKTKAKTLDQIMKRINIFKSRLDTLDRNPILKKILERMSDDEDDDKKDLEEKEKKSKIYSSSKPVEKQNEKEEFEYYSFKKKMQFDYKNKHKNKQSQKSKKSEKKDPNSKKSNVLERLVNNNNDFAEEQAINVTDNL